MDWQWQRPHLTLVPLRAESSVDSKKIHPRTPDIGLRLQVTLTNDDWRTCTYTAEYCGHGGSKTAFLLNGNPSLPFHDKILKVTAKEDVEPKVFATMEKRCPGTTLKILYNAYGAVHGGAVQYYCWITDRTIPLNQFLVDVPGVLPQRCVLAVVLCSAQCVRNGLRLSDCGFQNFGVLVNTSSQEHRLVAIDAGSYDLENVDRYNKGFCNAQVTKKIWNRARQVFKPEDDWESVRAVWKLGQDLPDAIRRLQSEWMTQPYLTTEQQTTLHIEVERQMRVLREKKQMMDSAVYKIIQLIVKHVMPDWWNEQLGLECYKAAEKTCQLLDQNQEELCKEMLSRLTTKGPPDWKRRSEQEIKNAMAWWCRLKQYRRELYPDNDWRLEGAEAQKALYWFSEHWWAHELTEKQKCSNSNRRRILGVKLHQHLLWKQAALAIMTQDLPMPEPRVSFNSGTPWLEELHAKLHFVNEMAMWIYSFAQIVAEYKQQEWYVEGRRKTPQLQPGHSRSLRCYRPWASLSSHYWE